VFTGGFLARRVSPGREWDNQDMAWIELAGAVNVRDVGGLPTVDGGETVHGRVLRSENLQELTDDDIVRLVDEIGVTTVVDLRSTASSTRTTRCSRSSSTLPTRSRRRCC
jgi:hypothetical protein